MKCDQPLSMSHKVILSIMVVKDSVCSEKGWKIQTAAILQLLGIVLWKLIQYKTNYKILEPVLHGHTLSMASTSLSLTLGVVPCDVQEGRWNSTMMNDITAVPSFITYIPKMTAISETVAALPAVAMEA